MNDNLIMVEQICLSHNIDSNFISTLASYGLVEVVVKNEMHYLPADTLVLVEKIIRLHYELEINIEGIDVIVNLLDRIEMLQKNLIDSQNQLRIFKGI